MHWTAENSEGYPAPVALATDVVVLTVTGGGLEVLVVRRTDGLHALPGGLVGERESPEATARRKLLEKTGLRDLYLEQLAAFAEPDRDPRGWIPSIAYLALVPAGASPSDPDAEWIPARGRRRLALDHRKVLRQGVDRLEGKLWWSNVAVGALPSEFSMSEARRVYEAIAGTTYDPATFARDLKSTGLIEATGKQREHGSGRPAALYRFRSKRLQWGSGRRKRVAAR
jgi:8-oxo-dGTP diphosphatase